MSKDRRLGLGLDALLGPSDSTAVSPEQEIDLAVIQPNPFQPRLSFDDEDIHALAESIRRAGLLQPLVVRRNNGHYELIAGERRLRAARLAGLGRVPTVVREIDDDRMLELALVENLQRRDLNPIEKARAFKRLMDFRGWGHEEVAAAVGLARPTVTNFLRLLELPPEIQEAVSRGTLTMGHARALLGTQNRAIQLQLLPRILTEELSVRAVEALLASRRPSSPASIPAKDPYMADLEKRLTDLLGTRVKLQKRSRGGRITVEWYTDAQLTGILGRLGVM